MPHSWAVTSTFTKTKRLFDPCEREDHADSRVKIEGGKKIQCFKCKAVYTIPTEIEMKKLQKLKKKYQVAVAEDQGVLTPLDLDPGAITVPIQGIEWGNP